ncbi:response regulator [Gracilibacillus sp. YIM 98692]|uniref:response regulator transcription factor n=1 Tax=Gracilibacillus sp. YIM 98692 TaxID=2663532 RepID=UPI0013D08B79|nr:response regulator [Gracilibacillus sp. YIM 98692]
MNIFVVEDEYWALLELRTLLKKYETNHNMFYFENGEEALDQLAETIPDLVITDITMPGTDGLELVEKLKSHDNKIECIFLTVHDTFDYAKKGIQLGVVDYILKPIKKDALFETIDQTLVSIHNRKKEETLKQQWSINRLLFQSMEQNNYDATSFDNQPLLMIYVLFGNWKAKNPLHVEVEVEKISEVMGKEKKFWFLSIDECRKILLIENDNDKNISRISIQKLFHYFNHLGQVHLCVHLKGNKMTLNESYQEAEKKMDNHKLFGEPTLLNQQNRCAEMIDKDITFLWDTVRVMESKLSDHQFASIPKQIDHLINQIRQARLPQKQLYRFLVDMYYAVIYKLQQSTSSIIKIEDIDDNIDQLETFITYDQLENWLTVLLSNISSSISHENIAPKHLIPKVKEWIQESYSDNITFQQFADEHHVSLSYLSREFKEQTNMTFSEYLTHIRIKKAKGLFEKGMEKTVEVGRLVGYHDPKHFRTVFKRVTGITPKEYKTKTNGG